MAPAVVPDPLRNDGCVNYLEFHLSSPSGPQGTRSGLGREVLWSYTLNYMNSRLPVGIQVRIRRGCVHAGAVILLVLPVFASTSPADQQALVEQLRTDYTAMVSAEHEYRIQRERGALNAREADEYAAYVARLYRRVAEDCRSVQQAGIRLPRDVVCPALVAMPMPMPAGIDPSTEQTRGEKTGVLDAELMAGLGEFDEMLLREQERVKASAPRTDAGAGGGGGGVSGGDGEGDGDGDSGNAGEGRQAGGGETGAQAAGGGAAGGGRGAAPPGSWNQPGGSGGQPQDIPDGSDDDVVARQLREAAEKETDPELKEKLWEEYRKYKQGTR
jgi:chorismate mutase